MTTTVSKISAKKIIGLTINEIIYLCGFIFLLIFTLFNNHPLFWDEALYIQNLEIIAKYGAFTEDYIYNIYGPAGPLFGWFHFILKPITQINVPWVRLVNIILLAGCIALIRSMITEIFTNLNKNKSLAVMTIPMVYVVSGLVLTEMPAIFFLTLSFYLFIKMINRSKMKYPLALLAGIAFSLAIIGRQPVLVALIVFPLVLIDQNLRNKNNYLAIFIFLISSLILPLYIFSVWKNIIPEFGNRAGDGFLAPFHGVLSVGYLFMVSLFVAPAFLKLPDRKSYYYFIGLLFLVIALNLLFNIVSYLPMVTTLSNFFSPRYLDLISRIFAALNIGLCCYFILVLYYRFLENQNNYFWIISGLAALFIVGAAAKTIHQFSSRYVVQALPFIMIMLAPYIQLKTKYVIFSITGMILGLISLISYFK